MNDEQKNQYEARAKIIKAMAHPSRLFIIEELKKDPCSVGALTEKIGADPSTVSKHLSILKNEGLVYDQKRGTTVLYYLKCPCVLDFINCIEDVLETQVNEQLTVLKSCKKR